MTDRIKGYLVTLDGDIRKDDAEKILNALAMIKGVFQVQPYVKDMEDYMMHQRGQIEVCQDLIAFLRERSQKKNAI